jgi:hypothetical protein
MQANFMRVLGPAEAVEMHQVKLMALAREFVNEAAKLTAKACAIQQEVESLKCVAQMIRDEAERMTGLSKA